MALREDLQAAETTLEAITALLNNWDALYLRVKQGGKSTYVTLDEVESQRTVLGFVKEQLDGWAAKKHPFRKKQREEGEVGVEGDEPTANDLWPEERLSAGGR